MSLSLSIHNSSSGGDGGGPMRGKTNRSLWNDLLNSTLVWFFRSFASSQRQSRCIFAQSSPLFVRVCAQYTPQKWINGTNCKTSQCDADNDDDDDDDQAENLRLQIGVRVQCATSGAWRSIGEKMSVKWRRRRKRKGMPNAAWRGRNRREIGRANKPVCNCISSHRYRRCMWHIDGIRILIAGVDTPSQQRAVAVDIIFCRLLNAARARADTFAWVRTRNSARSRRKKAEKSHVIRRARAIHRSEPKCQTGRMLIRTQSFHCYENVNFSADTDSGFGFRCVQHTPASCVGWTGRLNDELIKLQESQRWNSIKKFVKWKVKWRSSRSHSHPTADPRNENSRNVNFRLCAIAFVIAAHFYERSRARLSILFPGILCRSLHFTC